jgi:hypothetical protein
VTHHQASDNIAPAAGGGRDDNPKSFSLIERFGRGDRRSEQKRNYRIQHELENETSRHMSFFPLVINSRRKSVFIFAPILGEG